MRIFILEDNDERIEFFKSHYNYSNNMFVCVKDVETALRVLSDNTFDLIFLDHDLGTDENDKHRGTGSQIVAWLCQPKMSPQALVIIHSSNTVEGPNMERALREYGRKCWWLPFHIYKTKLIDEKIFEADIESWRRSLEEHGWKE